MVEYCRRAAKRRAFPSWVLPVEVVWMMLNPARGGGGGGDREADDDLLVQGWEAAFGEDGAEAGRGARTARCSWTGAAGCRIAC
eukprot:4737064-Pyramimonas_sp.AAC.1